jgi:uncharacterized protein YecA (UPF0149 family)
MKTLEQLPSYFQARENHLRAMARYCNMQKRLLELFDVTTVAGLEQAMLENRHLHLEERQQYNILAHQADRASDIYDLATVKQKELVAAQQKQYDAIVASLDE